MPPFQGLNEAALFPKALSWLGNVAPSALKLDEIRSAGGLALAVGGISKCRLIVISLRQISLHLPEDLELILLGRMEISGANAEGAEGLLAAWSGLSEFSLEGWTGENCWMSGQGQGHWKQEGANWYLEEKGTCRTEKTEGENPFWNFWVFRPGAEGVYEVAHARRGEPQHLVVLKPVSMGRWVSGEKHLCGSDEYACEVVLDSGEVRMVWQVRGPEKDYRLVRRYRMAQGGAE